MAGEGREQAQLAAMRARAAQTGAEIDQSVTEILRGVRERGLEAVREYSLRFDKAEPRELAREELEQAAGRIPAPLLAALRRSAEQIAHYQERLKEEIAFGVRWWDSPAGGQVGRTVRPLQRVGVYVPGGRAAYPSSVLMNVIPAKVAGVEEVVMVTPPTQHMSDAVLAAAWVAGVDRCIAVGGAQGVAALAYGAGFIPRVDKLVGPGNAFVAAAKRMVYGSLDIDMVAGPSEVLVIADETANPRYVAADLLSQAEHDPLASAVLLTTSLELARSVAGEIARQVEGLSRGGGHPGLPTGLWLRHCVRQLGGLRPAGRRDRPGAPGDRHSGAGDGTGAHPQRGGRLPGGVYPRAIGGLYGGAGPRAAHQRDGPVFLPPVGGRLCEEDQRAAL